MATRFGLASVSSPPVTPPISPTWSGNGGVAPGLWRLVRNTQQSAPFTATTGGNHNTASGVTANIVNVYFVSDPLVGQAIGGTISAVMRCIEGAATGNLTLAIIVRLVSNDGQTTRGTLLSVLGTDTEWGTTNSTRILTATTVTSQNAVCGDRIVVDLGFNAAAPTAIVAGNIQLQSIAGGDYALTSGLTTVLNPWIEFSQDLFPTVPNNYQAVNVGDGMGVNERIR